jgi:hypothetical protein
VLTEERVNYPSVRRLGIGKVDSDRTVELLVTPAGTLPPLKTAVKLR